MTSICHAGPHSDSASLPLTQDFMYVRMKFRLSIFLLDTSAEVNGSLTLSGADSILSAG